MTISIVCTDKDAAPWVSALHGIDPSLDIQVYPREVRKADVEFALCWKHPPGALRDYKNLRCICSMGAGVDNLLSDSQLPSYLPVLRLVDPQLAQSMFEYLCAVVMQQFRDLHTYHLRQQQSVWHREAVKEMANTTIGIMGLGNIGQHVAQNFAKMGFKVAGWSRTEKRVPGIKTFATHQQLEPFLSNVEILICLLPLTPSTQGILNFALFEKLPRGAFLVNVARGEHLVEQALLAALDQGLLSGACLDVFRQEPLPVDHPFWQHKRVLVTPHCSSITHPKLVAPQVVENYRRMKSGKALLNQVDIARGY